MLKDSEVAQLAHSIYSGADGFTKYFPESGFGICCAVLLNPDENVVVFRGTVPTDLQNWLQDLMACPSPFLHPQFGPLHGGSFIGMPDLMAEVAPLLNPEVLTTVGGHSLGGQRAVEGAALLLSKYQPDPAMLRLVSIAGPAAGFLPLLDYLAPLKSKVLYRNSRGVEGDLVPLLPFRLPPALDYRNLPRTQVTAVPGNWIEDMDPIAWHSSALYVAGIAALESKTPKEGGGNGDTTT